MPAIGLYFFIQSFVNNEFLLTCSSKYGKDKLYFFVKINRCKDLHISFILYVQSTQPGLKLLCKLHINFYSSHYFVDI